MDLDMAYLLDRDDMFEVRASGQGPDSGKGVFCKEDVKAGTIIEYTGIVFKESKAPKDMERTFIIAADYYTSKGKARTSATYSIDGHPHKEPVVSQEERKKIGCQINEASRGGSPNCMFTINPFLTRESFVDAFNNRTIVTATWVVIVEDLPSGTELLTLYGSGYGDRKYKHCKLKRKCHDLMVDKAYGFTDILFEQGQCPEEEPLTIPNIVIPDDSSVEVPVQPDDELSYEPEHKKIRFEEMC